MTRSVSIYILSNQVSSFSRIDSTGKRPQPLGDPEVESSFYPAFRTWRSCVGHAKTLNQMSEETLAVMSNSDREASLNPESSDAASTKTEKRSRASKPKTKTGCFTCRTRRVKCDEQKPFCNRCLKFGVSCDGYGVKERKKPTTKKQRVEQTAALIPPILLPKANDVQALISRFGSGVRFESELEARYFRVFCDQVAGQITGFFKTSLWERLIPQASEITPFIRHAIVAIGALSSLSKDTNFPLSPIGKHGLAEEHLYALTQYDKALQETKQLIATGGGSVRNALLGCLLFFCFETLQGRQGPACALARSGLTLFYRWAEEQKMTSQQILEDDIIQAFESLNLQVLFFIDERPLDLHQRLMKEATNGLEHMPSMFVDLDEARSYWQLIMRRNFHFKIEAQIKGNAADLVGEQRDMNWSDSANFCGGDIPFSKLKNPTPEIQWACQKYIEDIIRWSSAATTLFESIPPNDMSSVIVVNLLKIHALMNILILAGMTFSAETRFDAYLSEFREIVDLCTFCHPHLMASSEQSTLYRFDLGIIPALGLVASRCRDRETRARAIDLLESCHYREGFWDSYLLGAIGRWLRDLEEEAAGPNTYIPEDCRHFPTSADVDLYNRRVKVYATQRTGPRDEDMVFKEAILRW